MIKDCHRHIRKLVESPTKRVEAVLAVNSMFEEWDGIRGCACKADMPILLTILCSSVLCSMLLFNLFCNSYVKYLYLSYKCFNVESSSIN